MNHKYTHIEVGTEFFKLLMTNDVFKNNPTTIYPSYYFLNRIYNKSFTTDEEWIQYPSETIMNTFKPYTGGEYKIYLTALIELELLTSNNHYECPFTKPNGEVIKGECIGYNITDKCVDLLSNCKKEYLHNLINNKETKRKNDKNKSYKRKNIKSTNDIVIDTLTKNLHNLKIDHDKMNSIVKNNELDKDQETHNNIINNTLKMETYDYNNLEYKDGRLYTPWIGIKSDVRPSISLNKKDVQYTIDIRAAHPTFFSHYIISLYYNIISLPTIHYVTDLQDNCNEDIIKKEDIEREHKEWVELFTSEIDGRSIIAEELKMGDNVDRVKELLNKAINGQQNIIFWWIAGRFPNLFKTWIKTDAKKTGPNIAQQYESELIRSTQTYIQMNNIGMEIMDEHDGFSVFGSSDDGSLIKKIYFIVNFIKNYSKIKFGIEVKFKIYNIITQKKEMV